ncbi:tetratricopeptide repeat protein [Pseudemcibacter aquimaris]|uniref:tetratricopeptide repeat protein n=1 Tax=Pseudemcibacter aquimaris TaxID=2857064 RepID=UPI0020135682|nr:hypothetical protein [Pseudemcibacter aquimaris]MCC3860821.1 hypothetical protein [Pseudemcibacter aquimaris]WDU59641.1 hypothetical protein KW060_05120 [Pseudemcibacter aquimaris]
MIKIIKNNTCNKIKWVVSILMSLMFVTQVYAQDRLAVRSGDHPTYSRVVFDWTRNVTYSPVLDNDVLTITFNADAVPDFSSVMINGPAFFRNPAYSSQNGNLVVTFDTNNVDRIRHFTSGTKVVVDLLSNGTPLPADNVTANVVSANQGGATQPPATVPTPARPDNTANDAPVTSPAPVSVVDNNAFDGELTIRARATNDAYIIDYYWDSDVKAASFIRANKLWVVFDKFTTANHDAMRPLLGDRVLTADQLSDITPTVLSYNIAPNQNARMVKTGRGWQVSLRSNIAVPQLPIEIGHQSISNVGENIFLVGSDFGDVVSFEDPLIGDDLTVVTASQSSHGVIEQNNFSEFNILQSAQGIALQLIADDIFVTRHDNGVSVSGQNGLAITRSSVPIFNDNQAIAANGAEAPETLMLLDFSKWEEGPLQTTDFTDNRHELLYRLSTSTEDERNEARWNLATFDLAHNNAAEAFGVLQLMAEDEPAFLENPSFRALLAVSNIKLRRFEEALELLSHRAFLAELDAILWRALAHEALGNHAAAMEDFNKGIDVISLQTNDNRVAFLFSAIRSAEVVGDIEFMNGQINGMANTRLNAKQLTELDYWKARMAEGVGNEPLAADLYESVMATNVRYPAALAKFARFKQQFRTGEIDAIQAIDALEKLRFAWRGDKFELDILEQLGDLYVDMGEYREGLSILRQAATYFPRSPRTRDLTRQMGDIYHELFLGGGADNMAPLKAMALFLEFRELTPLGADGDTMSRNLARRMVTVDLLNDAAELLEHQVKNRLQGVARADIASDLAMIYLMNKEADKALQTLRATRQAQIPLDIERTRNMIEVRALVELGSYEEAEVMLEGVEGDDAENLRADIFWKTEDWNRVVDHGYRMLGDRWTDSAELNDFERQSVLRIAVALALDEDRNGLEVLRNQYLTHMENGLFSDAFELITSEEQRSGEDIRQVTQAIASVDRLETFMDSYRNEFATN